NKEKMTYGFAGIGSASHLCSLLFLNAIDSSINGAPYKGTAPALNDLMGGHLDFMCDQTINVLQPAKTGLIKAYAATTPQRLKVAPISRPCRNPNCRDFRWSFGTQCMRRKAHPSRSSTSYRRPCKAH